MATILTQAASAAPQDSNYCLKWNNHQENIVKCFSNLLTKGHFLDVTLAAEGKFVRAHRVILSCCSPYFDDLLSLHPEQNTIVFLKDVQFDELKALLDFMYKGEISISYDKMASFLRTAESLQIRGLTQSQVPSSNLSTSHATSSALEPVKLAPKRRRDSGESSDVYSSEDRSNRTTHEGLNVQIQVTPPPLKHRTMLTRTGSSSEARRRTGPATSNHQHLSEGSNVGAEGDNIGQSEDWSEEDESVVGKPEELLVPQLGLSECQSLWNNDNVTGESAVAGPSRISNKPLQQGTGITGGFLSQEAKLLSIIGQFGPTGVPFPKLSNFLYRPDCPPLDLCQSLPECSVYRQEHNSSSSNRSLSHAHNGESEDGEIATLYPDQRTRMAVPIVKIEPAHPPNVPSENTQLYGCTVCGKTYSLQRSLWRHAKYECRDKRKDFVCPLCGKSFMYRFRLTRHITRGACLTT